MSKNILDVYETLYKYSDNIKGESIDYNRGFQDAVYMLKLGLEKYEHINLHVENRRLRHKLLLLDLNFDDSMFTVEALRKELLALRNEINQHKNELRRQEKKAAKMGLVEDLPLCQLTIEDFQFDFFAPLTQDQLEGYMPVISEYIASRLRKERRKGKPLHKNDYKAWTLECLRNKGIKCFA